MGNFRLAWGHDETNEVAGEDIRDVPCDLRSWLNFTDLLVGRSTAAQMTTYPEREAPEQVTVTRSLD